MVKKKMQTKYNGLIFGKDDTERIVAIEIQDNSAELFIESKEGIVETKVIPNKFWTLAASKLDSKYIQLKGDLHYKYGRQFLNFSEYAKHRAYQKDSVYGVWDKVESLLLKDGITFFKGMKVSEVSILSFDIETVGVQQDMNSKVLLIANTYRSSKGDITRKMFCYDEYENQGQLLTAWCNWVGEVNPSIICGHNIYGFDIPYMQTVADLNKVKLNIGRDGSELFTSNRESRFRKDGSQTIGYKKIRCYGRSLIDTMFLSIKYDVGRKYENYKLKDIIKHEGLEKKDRTFYDASQIKNNYMISEEWEKIKSYAADDGDDALALYDLMSAPFFYMTQSIPKSYQLVLESATGSQINAMMVRSYLQNAHSIPKADDAPAFQGAISDGWPGVYKNAMKIDVASLYPSIIISKRIYSKDKDPEANFLNLLTEFTKLRLEYKKKAKLDKYFDDMQGAFKILINSFFGVCSTNGLQFNYPEGASEITRTGREILKQAIYWATGSNYE